MTQKVWYISKYASPPQFARVGNRGFFIMRELAKIGFKTTLITSDSNHLADPPDFKTKYYEKVIANVTVRWIKTRKYHAANSLARFLSWLSFDYRLMRNQPREVPDFVIISSLSLTTILVGIYLKWKFKCRLIFEIRDIWPLVLQHVKNYHRYNPLIISLGAIEKLGYRYSDLIIGTMPMLELHVDDTVSNFQRVVCIPQGYDPDFVRDFANLQLDNLSSYFSASQFTICYAGSMGEDNELATLLKTAELLSDFKDIKFVLCGDGSEKQILQNKYANFSNIHFTGMLTKPQIHSVFQKSDILYFGTYKNIIQKFGQSLNKVIDYMMAGKVIIGSYSGYPTMINEADCGEFVEAENPDLLRESILKYYYLSENDRAIIGNRGKTWLEENRNYSVLAKLYADELHSLKNI